MKLLLALSALLAAPTLAQAPGLPFTIPGSTATSSPYGVQIKRVNNVDTAPIVFEGQRLFVIGAPIAPDVAIPPIVQRVFAITDNLRRIVPAPSMFGGVSPSTLFDAKTFKVNIGSENGYPTLYATDATRRDVAPIMTLTESDAAINGVSKTDLAVQWQSVLQNALEHALLAEEPEYLSAQLRKLPFVIGGGILLTLLLVVLRRWLRRRYDEVDSDGQRSRLRRSIVSGALWLSNWAAFALWALIVIWVLGVVPVTRAFANELADRAVRIVLLWLGLALLDRLVSVAIVRISDGWESSPFADPNERARMTLRRPTFVSAAENLKSIVIWAVAIVATLSVFSISATSVLTIGAVVAFALSFATQSLIKDYLNGFLILVEDQFAIGDTVTINGFAGKVEDLTLRITRIRTDDGRLVTLPNSTITAVEKQTGRRSRVDSPGQDYSKERT